MIGVEHGEEVTAGPCISNVSGALGKGFDVARVVPCADHGFLDVVLVAQGGQARGAEQEVGAEDRGEAA